MRLIDADAYKDSIRKEKRWIVKRDGYINEGFSYDQVMFAIDKAPTIDAVPVKHGYWKFSDLSEIAGRTWYECTCCGKLINIQYNYCPNCGAEMDEEVSDETN